MRNDGPIEIETKSQFFSDMIRFFGHVIELVDVQSNRAA